MFFFIFTQHLSFDLKPCFDKLFWQAQVFHILCEWFWKKQHNNILVSVLLPWDKGKCTVVLVVWQYMYNATELFANPIVQVRECGKHTLHATPTWNTFQNCSTVTILMMGPYCILMPLRLTWHTACFANSLSSNTLPHTKKKSWLSWLWYHIWACSVVHFKWPKWWEA